jgi:bifunctional DNA-binding transcriptional regulator/antitoxin component of YhaV-PrlF toxin-antitoxin module
MGTLVYCVGEVMGTVSTRLLSALCLAWAPGLSSMVFGDVLELDAGAVRAGLSVAPIELEGTEGAEPGGRSYELREVAGLEGKREVEIYVRADGVRQVRPSVELPIHFLVDSDELADEVSRANLDKLAAILDELVDGGGEVPDPGAQQRGGRREAQQEIG